MFSYADGKYVPTNDLALPVKDDITGTFRGFRIFTACRTLANGKVFGLEDHIDRLFNSALKIHMELPHSKDKLKGIIQETVVKNRGEEGENKGLLLEIMYSGGEAASNGISPKGKAVLYILVLPLKLPPEEWYEQGIRLASFPYQRQWPEVKLLNYVGGVIAHQTVVKEYRAQEALFVSPDEKQVVLEGTTFNFFGVRSGIVLTHPLDGEILPGITRKVVLELAKKEGIEVKEDYFCLGELENMDEAFLTSSTRNIVPVVEVDEMAIGDGRPGKITDRLAKLFVAYQTSY